ncbi:MAG: hypothetical protein J7K73_02405 [Nanoarchaeota archaeon]|nr:hypothetical protein [Nanoarchaeota archaeon]
MFSYRWISWEIKEALKKHEDGKPLEECLEGKSIFARDAFLKGEKEVYRILSIGAYYNSLISAAVGTILEAEALLNENYKVVSASLGILFLSYSLVNMLYTKYSLKRKVREIFT